jgi:hypothetical protein
VLQYTTAATVKPAVCAHAPGQSQGSLGLIYATGHMRVASKCTDRILCSSVTRRDETRDELPILVTDYRLRKIVNPNNVRFHEGLFVRNHHCNLQICAIRIGSARILPNSDEELKKRSLDPR